jgi:hypothetical protein
MITAPIHRNAVSRVTEYFQIAGRALKAVPASNGSDDSPAAWAVYDEAGRHVGSLYQWHFGEMYLTNHRGPGGLRLGCRDFARAALLAVRGY